MNTIRFEQAIFTSATRASSEGYRLIAASSGIGSAERRVIQRCAPSHASLTTDSDAARATSFLALPDGRLCVARSTHVGMEQTGRGGRRVYTHLLVLAADDFAAFDSNPFHILRLAEQAGVLTPDVDASGTLDPIALTPQPDGSAVDRVTIGLDRVEPHRLRFVVERLIAGAKLVVLTPDAATEIAEAVFLAVPAPLRPEISFATGLKFSLTRQFTFNLLESGDGSPPRRLRGAGLELLDLTGRQPLPPSDGSAWARMVETLWADRAIDDLLSVSACMQLDTADDGLDRLATLTLSVHGINESTRSELIAAGVRIVGSSPQTGAETEAVEHFWHRLADRLVTVWPVPQDEAARGDWPVVAKWPSRAPLVATHLSKALAALLTRIARSDPTDAMAQALVLAREPGEPWADAIKACEATLTERFGVWARSIDDAAVRERALVLAEEWHRVRPDSALATETLNVLREQVACLP